MGPVTIMLWIAVAFLAATLLAWIALLWLYVYQQAKTDLTVPALQPGAKVKFRDREMMVTFVTHTMNEGTNVTLRDRVHAAREMRLR